MRDLLLNIKYNLRDFDERRLELFEMNDRKMKQLNDEFDAELNRKFEDS